MICEHSLITIAKATIKGVLPSTLIRSVIKTQDHCGTLKISVGGKNYDIQNDKGCHVVGFGKAVIGMSAEISRILGPNIKSGVLSVPVGIQECLRSSGQLDQLLPSQSPIRVFEGALNNLPDQLSLSAAKEISSLASILEEDDLLFVLISGGGSALLPAPTCPLTLEDKLGVIKKLSHAGASIQELNIVRIALSDLKGGKLARLAHPAKVVGLILSDIIDDPLDLISSGPTVIRSEIDFTEAAKMVLGKYNIIDDKVQKVLDFHIGKVDRTQVNVNNILIGNNTKALQVAKESSEDLGFSSIILSNKICGEARLVGDKFAGLARKIISSEEISDKDLEYLNLDSTELQKVIQELKEVSSACLKSKKPLCLIGGGETVVKVTGNGKGGRNQEMVLSAILTLKSMQAELSDSLETVFLSIGTDGMDGPTDAAGAVASPRVIDDALRQGCVDPQVALDENNSYAFFSSVNDGKNLIKIGHTGTNVMDVHLLAIVPKNR